VRARVSSLVKVGFIIFYVSMSCSRRFYPVLAAERRGSLGKENKSSTLFYETVYFSSSVI